MNGFDPLGGLKEWHVVAVLALAATGIGFGVVKLIMGIIWLIQHTQFT